jgi:CheY-like chemotaxis protein
MVKALFGGEGHTVEVARNPQHALDLVRSKSYDLILADGEARSRNQRFVQALVDSHPGLRDRVLVAMAGREQLAGDDAPARLGLRYVRKPLNLRDLLDEAARVWAAAALS